MHDGTSPHYGIAVYLEKDERRKCRLMRHLHRRKKPYWFQRVREYRDFSYRRNDVP
jgi:hypothetical protein